MPIPRRRSYPHPDRLQEGRRCQRRQGPKKGITLKKLPASGSYKISVTATTILKQKLTGSQSYKACAKGSGKIKLKGSKKHH